jgi:hypothetical protein
MLTITGERMSQEVMTDKLKTAYTEVELVCPRCRSKWSPVVANFVNFGTDPQGRDGMLRKTMHHAYCPVCKHHMEIDHIFAVYDPEENLVVQVRPRWEFRAGGGEEIYWKRLENLVEKFADTDVRVDIAFGYDELIEKFLGGQEAIAAALERAEAEKAAGLKPGTLARSLAGLPADPPAG